MYSAKISFEGIGTFLVQSQNKYKKSENEKSLKDGHGFLNPFPFGR